MVTTTTPATRSRPLVRRQPEGAPPARVNVSDAERILCFAGGGGLAAYGLTRGTLGGLALAALGGVLAYRGVSGFCPVYDALRIDTSRGGTGPSTSVPAGHGC